MTLDKRINAFVRLGIFLRQFVDGKKEEVLEELNNSYFADFELLISKQKALNGWFTKENVLASIASLSNMLREGDLRKWVENYPFSDVNNAPKRIGVIMAGNIPLVGFHDFLSVLITGNVLVGKLSSDDTTLLVKMATILQSIEKGFEDKIVFTNKLENFDAVIATGSNNTARYFDYYFGKYPHIIRKNRNSVAIVQEEDTKEELQLLGKDIFQYFGLGCRNVSKLYVPKGFNFDVFFEAIYEGYQEVIHHNKYANNYDYNKAIYLMGELKLLDNGFLLLKEDTEIASPIGVLFYEYYDSMETLKQQLEMNKSDIQCMVSGKSSVENTLAFGEAQSPKLWDYADGVDTIKFLHGLG